MQMAKSDAGFHIAHANARMARFEWVYGALAYLFVVHR